jgi:hypothetical protein
MLDGKRYYAVFPDEDPELQPRIRAVLNALGKLDKAFRQHLEAFQPKNLYRGAGASQSRWVRGDWPPRGERKITSLNFDNDHRCRQTT